MKYKNLIKRSQEQLTKEQLAYQAEDAEAQLREDLRLTQRAIKVAERELSQLKCAARLSSQALLDKMTEIEAYQEGVAKLEKLLEELF